MRKLAWFVIIVLVVALSIAVACAYSPMFSATIYDFGVNTVGASIVNGVTGAMTGMMAWGATGLGPAVAVVSVTLIAGSILWLVILKRYIWPHVHPVAAKASSQIGGMTMQREPAEPEPPQKKEEPLQSVVEK